MPSSGFAAADCLSEPPSGVAGVEAEEEADLLAELLPQRRTPTPPRRHCLSRLRGWGRGDRQAEAQWRRWASESSPDPRSWSRKAHACLADRRMPVAAMGTGRLIFVPKVIRSLSLHGNRLRLQKNVRLTCGASGGFGPDRNRLEGSEFFAPSSNYLTPQHQYWWGHWGRVVLPVTAKRH